MRFPLFLQALLLGFQHSFEPDHMAAVSVLATNKRSLKDNVIPVLWRGSQWALGHGFTLMILSLAALLFKSSLPEQLSVLIEVWVIGPVMIGLGILAMWRAFTLYSHEHSHKHDSHSHEHVTVAAETEHSHVHSHVKGERLTLFNRSFGIGMLHGVAGTGGALAIALGLAADSVATAVTILLLESLGVLVAMLVYSVLLVFAMRQLAKRHTVFLRIINLVVGVVSIGVGILWLYQGLIG